jgi:SAM-dependent methyltransferase
MDETGLHRQLATYGELDTYEKVRRLLDFEYGTKLHILDVGCGRGVLDEHLRQLGHTVVGLDINDSLVYDNVNIIRADIVGSWPCVDGSFDLVICTDVPEHLYDPAHVLSESARVLKPDGRIIFGVPNHFDFRQRLRMLRGKGIVHWDSLQYGLQAWDFPHIRFFTLDELDQKFAHEGWRVLCHQFNFMGCGLIPSSCKSLNNILLHLSPRLFSGKFVLLAGRAEHYKNAEKDIYVPKTYPGM